MEMSEDVIKQLATELSKQLLIDAQERCIFKEINPRDLQEAVKFYKNFNRVMEESKLTLWKTLVIGFTTGTIGLIILGIYHKFKDGM